jgi:hypothetical protein
LKRARLGQANISNAVQLVPIYSMQLLLKTLRDDDSLVGQYGFGEVCETD